MCVCVDSWAGCERRLWNVNEAVQQVSLSMFSDKADSSIHHLIALSLSPDYLLSFLVLIHAHAHSHLAHTECVKTNTKTVSHGQSAYLRCSRFWLDFDSVIFAVYGCVCYVCTSLHRNESHESIVSVFIESLEMWVHKHTMHNCTSLNHHLFCFMQIQWQCRSAFRCLGWSHVRDKCKMPPNETWSYFLY